MDINKLEDERRGLVRELHATEGRVSDLRYALGRIDGQIDLLRIIACQRSADGEQSACTKPPKPPILPPSMQGEEL